jgi:alginate O-acetyltransferase complex protein AlgI
MTFNSLPYLVFLAATVLVYWLLPAAARRWFVLLASVAFYASWSIVIVGVLFFVAAIVFCVGKRVEKGGSNSRFWIRSGIIVLLSLLIALKYRNALAIDFTVFKNFFAFHRLSTAATIGFPVGISFYTLEAIGYLIDVRQGRSKMPKFTHLCLFFMFWPNILSGPIVRARELMPQLDFRKRFEPKFMFEGFDRVIWGLVQKSVVANVLGIWVDRGFAPSAAGMPSTIDGWFLAIAFALQIYFDFAGYTNIAIGTARLLGVVLPENFRQPYHAATPVEFWARWHMTLSRWIRDYLFFPINAKWKGAPLPLYLSLIGVMGLVGLWHGAGWNFVVWGLLHGFFLVTYRIYETFSLGAGRWSKSRFSAATWRVITLVAVTVAWVPFRAASLTKAGSILSAMFFHFAMVHSYSSLFYIFTVVVVLFCVVEPRLYEGLSTVDEHAGANGSSVFRIIGRPLAYLFGLLLFMLFDSNNTEFIYSQF